MPIFKLFAAAEGEPSTSHEKPTSTSADLSFPPENELIELIWENGQVTMQGQSSRAKKNPSSCNTLPPCSLPLHSPKRGKDLSSAPHASSSVKFRTSNSSLNEFPLSVPLEEMCMRNDDDDDIVPWFDYLIDESLQNDYCSDFLPELSGITASEPSQKDFDMTKRGGCINHVHRDVIHDDLNVNHVNSSKSSSLAVVSEATRHGTSPSLAGLAQFPSLRPRYVSENTGTTSNHIVSGNSSQVTSSAVGLSSEKLRKRNLGPSVNHDEFLNFSHFSRPAVLYKSTLGKNCAIDDSGPSSLGRDHFIQKDCSPDVKTVKSNSGPIREMGSHGHYAVEKEITYSGPLEATPNEELPSRESEEIGQEHAAKDDKQRNDGSGENTCEEPLDAIEPVVASSICSGNGIDSVSDELPINLKRKVHRNYDSEAPSDDVEDDSVGLGKSVPARCSSSKRSRSAEVHNLSERRRRDRINEKMRALQELIPNCNKVDKASMLDEAIDYLKTLQLQVQMMSMGAGLYVPPMMLPAHTPQFSPMSIGMAAGLGFGMGTVEPNGGPTACPMFWVPPMQGAHFPSPVMSGHQALHGMGGSSFPVMGFPSTMLPFSMPHVPLLVPSPGGTSLVPPALNANVVKGHVDNTGAAFASSPKEATENINGASCSMNNISSQYQARNGGFELPEDPYITTTTAPTEVTGPSKAASVEKPA